MVPSQRHFNPDTVLILQYKDLIQLKEEKSRYLWKSGLSKEFGQLADGLSGKVHKGTNTISLVTHNIIPVGSTAIYSFIVVNVQPQKEDSIRCRLTIGVNCIQYPGKVVSTKTADLATFKLHINSLTCTRGEKYAVWDIINYYIKTPMGQ